MYALPDPISLRPLAPGDQAFTEHLYASSRSDLQCASTDADFVARLIRQQQHVQTVGIQQNYPNAQRWIIQMAEKAIGRLIVDTAESGLHLVDIILLPEAQQKGVGRAVLRALQSFAKKEGLDMSLTVSKTNPAAKNLYQSLGFTVQANDALVDHMHWPSRTSTAACGAQ